MGIAVACGATITGGLGLPPPFLLRDLSRLRRDLPGIHNLLLLPIGLLSPWMGFLVGAPNMLGSETGVNLGGRDIGVSQELLN